MNDCCHTATALLPVEAALERLLAACPPPPETEEVTLADALGRVLAEPVRAQVDVPGHDNSAMDGYAVRRSDLAAARELPLGPVVVAGSAPQALPAGQAARIFTGAPIPAGADAVVMQEQCEARAGSVLLPEDIKSGQNIRRAGEDVRVGSIVLEPSQRLTPQALGLAAAVGVARLRVRRRLRVALLATGDELVPAGQALAPGQIHDSNGPMMAALLAQLGYECVGPDHLADDYAATRDGLAHAATTADVVITTGGVSVGDEDHVKPAVQELGELDLWRVAIKPGKPFAFGRIGATPFLGLPGNPVSVFVTFLILARPFLARQQGLAAQAPGEFRVEAGFEHARPDRKRREYLRVRLRAEGARVVAEAYDHQGSGVLSSTAWADGLVRLEPGQTVTAGEPVPYLPYAQLLA